MNGYSESGCQSLIPTGYCLIDTKRGEGIDGGKIMQGGWGNQGVNEQRGRKE